MSDLVCFECGYSEKTWANDCLLHKELIKARKQGAREELEKLIRFGRENNDSGMIYREIFNCLKELEA